MDGRHTTTSQMAQSRDFENEQDSFFSCQACQNIDDDEMVQCDICNGWYHYICAGPGITDDIANYSWNCAKCEKDNFQTPSRSNVPVPPNITTNQPSVMQTFKETNMSVSGSRSQQMYLEYMEEQRKLEEERMNKSFEIQRRFLKERFNVLKMTTDEDPCASEAINLSRRSAAVNTKLERQPVVESRNVRFGNLDERDIQTPTGNIIRNVTTPLRVPHTDYERFSPQQWNEEINQRTARTDVFEPKLDPPAISMSACTISDVQKDERSFQPKISSTAQSKKKVFEFPVSSMGKPSFQENLPSFSSCQQPRVQDKLGFSTGIQEPSAILPVGQQSKFSGTFTNIPDNTRADPISQQSVDPVMSRLQVSYQDKTRQPNPPTSLETQSNDYRGAAPQTSMSSTFSRRMLDANQIAARQVLPRELPKFHGTPEEWPLFISGYESSTETGGYSNAENLIRLQRCLQGRALEAVRSILLTPDNVPNVIETLRMMYGRPDLIIYSLIQQVREEPSPKMERLESLINFALSVRNLCSIIKTTHLDAHMNNPYLMQEIMEKIPATLRLEWSRFKRNTPNSNMETLGDWLYEVAQAASDVVTPLVSNKEKSKKTDFNVNKKMDSNANRKFDFHDHKKFDFHDSKKFDVKPQQEKLYVSAHNEESSTASIECRICSLNCTKVANCKKFQNFTVEQRWIAVKDDKLCSTCLKIHRRFQCRDKKRCSEKGCEAWHHIMLHKDPERINEQKFATCGVHQNIYHSVIYRIIPVILYGPSNSVETFAYLDGGSGITLIEEGLVKLLGIEGESSRLCLQWTSKIQRSEPKSQIIDLQISDKFGQKRYSMSNVRTVQSLELPTQTLTKELVDNYSYLRGIPIQTYERAVSKILIGLENINLIVSLQTIEGGWQEPVATKTRLGWVLQGGPQKFFKKSLPCFPISEKEPDLALHQLVKDFFSLESFGVKVPDHIIESKQDARARQIMKSTTVVRDRRCETGLLWKHDKIQFPDSFNMARKRLESLERKMLKDDRLAQNMKQQLQDYESNNYTRKLSTEEINQKDETIWYLPVFPVLDPKKPDKFRIVWDAAAEVQGVSLNSNLLTGPDLLVPLPEILLRFREKAIAIGGDIKEMFHQIVVRIEDQNAQRFLWRDGDQTKEPEIFVMQRLTFGATCSPSIAQFVKNENAKMFENEFPLAAKTIIKNHYVDDMIDCTHTIDEAVKLIREVKYIHEQTGFEIRKFRSNSQEVIQRLGEKAEKKTINLSFNQNIERILGMYWNTSLDTFTFSLQFSKLTEDLLNGHRRPTKREVLSTLMTIFDPLGLLGFFLIYVKILLQEIWSSKIGWDNEISDIQFAKWTTWIEMLPEIEDLSIPRLYSKKLSPNAPKSIELHVFVDASELAYSTVAYLRIEDEGGVECVLVGSKTRVAPLKPMSIPRLELQAGVLGARFAKNLSESQTLKIDRRCFWTDSRVLLQWLHSESSRKYRQFVAFRVGEILESTEINEWHWVPTKDNVADEATKWTKKPIMSNSSRWFQGPDFLREHNNWEMDWSTFEYEYVQEEARFQITHEEILPPEIPDPVRFSKWERILRSQAYVLRVVQNVATIFKIPKSDLLTSEELQAAETSLFKRAQFDEFGSEVSIIQWNYKNPDKPKRYIESPSSLYQCVPYMDETGIMRVHGRIDATPGLSVATTSPIILPRNHRITELLIDWYHRKFHHGNHETVINELKQSYYIPRIRVALKSVVHKCQWCKNKRARPVVPSMADLPAARLTPHFRAFTNTGVDYFGPLIVTVRRSHEKRYGVLMTCLTTRAIHIEIVNSLDTDSCIMAIRNFMARRGQVSKIFSDNGTNFHASETELKNEFLKMNPVLMEQEFTTPTMTWYFNPPAAPHMGGSWERLVRSVKTSLYHILRERHPSDEILRNVLMECENIVNSRPLTFVSVDNSEEEALTPNHFLLGSSGRLPIPCELDPDQTVFKRNWKTSQMLINHFWSRWVREYLPTITRRTKWFQDVKPVEVGDIVYIVDEHLKRNSWPKGIIQEVYPGKDNQVRSASVRTAYNIYRRPVSKLAVLDITPPTVQLPSLPSPSDVNENINPIAAKRVLSNLPQFNGSVENWPTFISTYEDSTAAAEFSNEENLIRLQNCLHGPALEAVNQILLSPDDVPVAIQRLKELYHPIQH